MDLQKYFAVKKLNGKVQQMIARETAEALLKFCNQEARRSEREALTREQEAKTETNRLLDESAGATEELEKLMNKPEYPLYIG